MSRKGRQEVLPPVRRCARYGLRGVRVGEDLAKVTRDNSLVYYESVPEAGALPPIAPKLLAKPAGATQPAGLPGLLAGWLDQLTRPAE